MFQGQTLAVSRAVVVICISSSGVLNEQCSVVIVVVYG